MINEELAAAARRLLSCTAGEQWVELRSEIQDNGTFLLLMARIPYGHPAEVSPELKREAASALNALIPKQPTQTEGSWQLNVYRGTVLVDAVFPNES